MSKYGVKIGCYKYQNETNDNGQIVHIKSLTKQFVGYDIYTYYDNKYSLPHLQSIAPLLAIKHSCDKKMVKQLSGLPSFGASLFISTNNQYKLNDQQFIGANTYLEWKQKNKTEEEQPVVEEEQPVVEDDGTAENDLDELEVCEYKKEVESWCPKRHITEWGDYGYKYTLDKKWVKEVLDFLDTAHLNNDLADNGRSMKKLLTNNDRIYDSDRVLIERFVEFLKTDFMTTNVFLLVH
tara:strand:- start:7278 stop:7988 length:711 start_codon:yes stop_codon:yes gene_type:complete